MAEIDSEAPEAVYLIRKHGGYYGKNSRGYTGSAILAGRYTLAEAERETHPNGPDGCRDGMTYVHEDEIRDEDWLEHRRLMTAAEAERDEAMWMVAALRKAADIWAVSDSDLFLIIRDTAAAAREYRARVVEQCADIAAAATITDHDNLSWTDGRRVAVEAIRAHAADVREGRG